ncbi:MAG: potassium channel protein [Deltaproteobacteria bacterium]|nr:potassium channel protein [Deltaproteobacteria bacterium]
MLASRRLRRNVVFLVKFCVFLVVLIVAYALLFDLFMYLEGREYSFVTGLYWSLTTMTTLGYGDVTFQSDAGRAFSLVVLLSGMVFMLVLLPFIIIQFVYTPIVQAQEASRAPKELPPESLGHVLLTSYDAVSQALITRLEAQGISYAVIVPDIKEAVGLHDLGLRVMVGEVDDPETYRKARVHRASLVAVTAENDPLNTNIVFTVRPFSEVVPVVSIVQNPEAQDILELAGSTEVLLPSELLGTAMANCAGGGRATAHVMGRLGEVLMVEAHAHGTEWVGRTLAEAAFGERLGIGVAGIWERGRFELAGPDSRITENSVLFLGLSAEQLERYNALVGGGEQAAGRVLIIGGGSVGKATARVLEARKIDYRIIDQADVPGHAAAGRVVSGDAADLDVLREAGFDEATAVLVTTHDDDTNIYLTIYCRRLRPNVPIVSRATYERNVATLHRAGADFVFSAASMGANAIFNHLRHGTTLMMVEGLFAKRVPVPPGLRGRTLIEAQVRARSGCSVVALEHDEQLTVNPPPNLALPEGGHLVLIVTPETERRFEKAFGRA